MKEGIENRIALLVFLFCMASAVSGRCQLKCDTIRAGNQYIIAEYPAISKSYIQNYEEGFFKTIICLEDTAFITIHCGAMMNVPLTQMSDKTITSEFRLNKDIRITRGYSVKNNRRKYFREDNYFKYGVNIVYDNIDENNINKYEQYFNNIKIYRKDIPEKKRIGQLLEFSAFEVDSIVYTLRADNMFLCADITRDRFDEWKHRCSSTVLKDKSHIQEVVNALKICTIDSILPYDSNTVVKNIKFVMFMSSGNIEVAWFNEDKIDVWGRVLFFTKDDVVVLWIAQTGVLDIGKYRCSNGLTLKNVLRRYLPE